MKAPDGMASMATERKHMKKMRQETRTPPWELAALDEDGNELYRTEYCESQEEAERLAELSNEQDDHEDVARFEARRTE